MPKIDDQVELTPEGYFGFVVRQDDNRLIAHFAFESRGDAHTAREKMKEILEKCRVVTGLS